MHGYSQREPEMVDSFRGNFFLCFHICQEEVQGGKKEERKSGKGKNRGKGKHPGKLTSSVFGDLIFV